MRLTIYIQNQPLVLTDTALPTENAMAWEAGLDCLKLIQALEQATTTQKTVVLSKPSEFAAMQAEFFKHFKQQEAAGGLVLNPQKKVLAMYRRGCWDMPKGKTEKGETLIETAVREVQEETGLQQLDVQKFLLTTYHSFWQPQKQRRVLKISHWFLMQTADTKLVPQAEEDIEILEWVDYQDFVQNKTPIYPNILDVLAANS
jgi:8-oxo-dGTP pyrophosphatase MutT (NUDIX family)